MVSIKAKSPRNHNIFSSSSSTLSTMQRNIYKESHRSTVIRTGPRYNVINVLSCTTLAVNEKDKRIIVSHVCLFMIKG